jgi:hypothetical protein
MPVQMDEAVRSFGTRVRLFPQAPFLPGFGEPEIVWLSPPAGTIQPGPADDRFYVVDAIEKPSPYEFPYLPPFLGIANPPVLPGPEGHFDQLPPDSREFMVVHAYGSLRRVLDIFESYFGRQLPWHFRDYYDRLEVIPGLDWDNAQSGYGYMELGHAFDAAGGLEPFALNFDVLAHELGHAILFSALDLPASADLWTPQFGAFHESCADLVALISLAHFDTVLDRLLHKTRGNIYVLNELNRIAELSETRQIRIASNGAKMSDVSDEIHDLSRPLTGAFFDIFFVEELYARGLISKDLRDESQGGAYQGRSAERLQAGIADAYAGRHFLFRSALEQARDMVGLRLAALWDTLSPNSLEYTDVLTALLAIDRRLSGGPRFQEELRAIFHWRGIYEYQTYPNAQF